MMTRGIVVATTLMICLSAVALPAPPDAVPAGAYTLDRAHSSLLFRINHLGFSHYTARFRQFDATLRFDPAHIEASKLTVTVDASSLETDYPDPAKLDFNAQLRGPEWLDATKHPQMSFHSTRVVSRGQRAFRIEGELTLRGITRPMILEATYNGGYAGHPMDPHARVGFSARGRLRRSAFGMAVGIPPPGTSMGVSDMVDVIVETEFTGPPLTKARAGK
jgi:polyisoprenoid-binding protein YceI